MPDVRDSVKSPEQLPGNDRVWDQKLFKDEKTEEKGS